jgi:hypothetical protein
LSQAVQIADWQLSQEELEFAQVLLDPARFAAAFMRDLDGDDSNAPLQLWPHQIEDVRDTHELIIHQDGRAVGKTVNVTVLVCHFGCTTRNKRMLVTTPNEGHLQKIIQEVEDQIFGSDFIHDQVAVDTQTGRLRISKKPYYEMRWKDGSIIYFRPAGPTGKSVRSLHCDDVLIDEAAWYPDPAWRALRRVLNRGGRMRAYTNPNGLRKTVYYDLTTNPKMGAKVVKWPSWIVPGWTAEDTEREARFYGGKDSPGFQHEVAGEHGAPSYTAFSVRQLRNCQRKLDNIYKLINIEGEELASIYSIDRATRLLHERLADVEAEDGTYYLGGDLGYTNDPSELTVWREGEKAELVPVLRIHNEHLAYTYQAALIALLDDIFDFVGLGIDAGSNGRSVEHILTTDDRYSDHHFVGRLEAYDFGSSMVVGYDDSTGKQKSRPTKEYMTSLIAGRLSARTIRIPTPETDMDWEDQFATQTYSYTSAGNLVYSKGNDHILDSTRAAVLRVERERLKQYDLNDEGQFDGEFVMPVITDRVFN